MILQTIVTLISILFNLIIIALSILIPTFIIINIIRKNKEEKSRKYYFTCKCCGKKDWYWKGIGREELNELLKNENIDSTNYCIDCHRKYCDEHSCLDHFSKPYQRILKKDSILFRKIHIYIDNYEETEIQNMIIDEKKIPIVSASIENYHTTKENFEKNKGLIRKFEKRVKKYEHYT